MPFQKKLVQGVTFHYSRPLLKNSSHVFYTAWWRDTVTTITGSAEVKDHFFFDYGEQTIPASISKKSHLELLEDMKQNKFDSYKKGASPMIISDSQMIFNFGNKDRIGYGLYDKSEGQTYFFDDYRPSPQEQLLTPVMFEDENFYSIVYPYELRKHIDSGLISESDFKTSFLEKLENQPEDGKPILVQFQLSDSK